MLNWSSRILSTAIMWVRSMQHRVCHKSVASLFSVVVWGHALSHPLGMAISFDIFWPIPITSSFQKAMFCVENNCEDLIVRFLPPRNPNKEQYVHVITSESPVYIYIYCNICARAVHNILLYIYIQLNIIRPIIVYHYIRWILTQIAVPGDRPAAQPPPEAKPPKPIKSKSQGFHCKCKCVLLLLPLRLNLALNWLMMAHDWVECL